MAVMCRERSHEYLISVTMWVVWVTNRPHRGSDSKQSRWKTLMHLHLRKSSRACAKLKPRA